MSRFYEAGGENPAEYLYWPNLRRAVRGQRGQKVLREFIAALLAMDERRLISGMIQSPQGDVCAVGAYAKYKGYQGLTEDDGEPRYWEGDQEETIDLGVTLGMGKMIAWHLGFMNDNECPDKMVFVRNPLVLIEEWNQYSDRTGRVAMRWVDALGTVRESGFTPEERWQHIYDWASTEVRWNLPAVASI